MLFRSSYTNCFKQELGTFPFGVHDDLVDAHTQQIIKCIPLLVGEEKGDHKVTRYTRYTEWWPEMEVDFKALKTQEERNAFIQMHGANKKWQKYEIN